MEHKSEKIILYRTSSLHFASEFYPYLYGREKINQIGKLLAEVIEEAVKQTEAESVRVGDVEMALRENLLAIEPTLFYATRQPDCSGRRY